MRSAPSARSSRRFAWIALGSLLVHAAALSLMPARAPQPQAALASPSLVTFESVVQPSPDEVVEAVASAAQPSVAEHGVRAGARARVASVQEPAVADTVQGSLPSSPVEPSPVASSVPASPAPSPRIDLSPRAAALSLVPQVAAQHSAEANVRSGDELARERGQELSASLRAAAGAEVARLQPRKLELRREPDGTCHYAGTAIDATILADGGVVFSDKAVETQPRWGVDEPAERRYSEEEAVAPQQLALGMRVAGRAWDAERKWFLRETEEIRRELADAAHERELRAAEHRLRAQLDRIWCNEGMSKPARRRAIYTLWAEISADDVGPRGRAVIIDYVRRNLPAGSPDAYTPGELTQLASLSPRAQRFDPYAEGGSPDAAVAP